MQLRNLEIIDCEINNKNKIIDGINELDLIINDNYQFIKHREIAIEFNIGSRLGEQNEYLIVYSNPGYKNNPYVFILKRDENNVKTLVNSTSLTSFQNLADMITRREVFHVLAKGFERLPQHAFLSQEQIIEARKIAKKYDELER